MGRTPLFGERGRGKTVIGLLLGKLFLSEEM